MAKPKLALIPSTVGGSVYSVLPSNGDGDFNFTRASAATRINAQGLIETVAATDNRLNYPLLDGTVQTCPHLLLEPQRTNLFTYSQSFQGWGESGTNTTTAQNTAISPDGSLNALKIKGSSDVDNNGLAEFFTISSGVQSYSIFAKAGEINIFQVGFGGTFGSTYANVNLSNGVVEVESGQTTTVNNFGNGWYRITSVATATAGSGYWFFNIGNDPSMARNGNYIGNGTDGLYLYGVQTEQGSYSTSYIVSNSGLATTRLAEVCNGSGNASTFNSSEGVLMANIYTENDNTFNYITISDGGTSNYCAILITDTDNEIIFRYYIAGAGVAITANVNLSQFNKVLVKYKQNDFALWVNGFELGSSNSGNVHSSNVFTELSYARGSTNTPFYGKTKQLQYFDSALTDSELETLTSWMSFSDMAIDLNYTIQ